MALKIQQRAIAVPLGADPIVSPGYDVRSSSILGVSSVLAGLNDGAAVQVTLQGSNETPPPGVSFGNWSGPADESWFPLLDDQGNAMAASLTSANNGQAVNFSTIANAAAWARVVATPTGANAGTLVCDVVGKDRS